jgi:ATP-dependent Clp protease protease subunit
MGDSVGFGFGGGGGGGYGYGYGGASGGGYGGDRNESDDWRRTLAQRLFEQRVVMLSGPLDDLSANRVAAELMTLDAEGDSAVTLRIDSGEGAIATALTLMDVVELLGVPVHGLALGQVGAAALGVLAVCSHRAAMPSARFSLREPRTETVAPAREVAQWARLRADERQRFCERLAAAAGKPVAVVVEDLTRGLLMSAEEALGYGLIEEISRPSADIHQMPGSPIGFRPLR